MEVSGSWSDLKQTKAIPLPNQFDDTFTSRIRGLTLATGRLGYAMNRTLLYAKAGYAGANVRTSALDTVTNDNQVGSAPNTWADDRWHHGWTVGGGWGFKLAPNVSLEVDYSYVKLQTRDHTATILNSEGAPARATSSTASYDIDPRIHAVTARFNYNFSGR